MRLPLSLAHSLQNRGEDRLICREMVTPRTTTAVASRPGRSARSVTSAYPGTENLALDALLGVMRSFRLGRRRLYLRPRRSRRVEDVAVKGHGLLRLGVQGR